MQRKEYSVSGSGVIISDDGYIVTNNHVVQDAESIQVTLNDKKVLPAQLIGTDPATDLALIKIDAADLKLKLAEALEGSAPESAVVVRADKAVPVEQIVYTLDAVEQINASSDGMHKHKVSLATKDQ